MKPGCATLLMALFLALPPTARASTTWYVNGTTGSDNNDCKSPTTACKTIGHAISLASSGDSIMVAAATYTENLTIGLSLKILGAGATTTIIDGGKVSTVVTVSSSNVILSKFTIRNGSVVAGVNKGGGGIFNSGTLTVSNSIVSGNSVSASFFAGLGGGIYNAGTLTITNSTLSGNFAITGSFPTRSDADGGGLYNGGTLTTNKSTLSDNYGITNDTFGGPFANGGGIYMSSGSTTIINNSTLSDNFFAGFEGLYGGGIYNGGGTLTINNSTLSGNSSGPSGGGIFNSGTLTMNNSTLSDNFSAEGGAGSGISGPATLQNTIVANNIPSGNCSGTITSNGYNLSSHVTCNFNNTGDLNNTDPVLGPLQNNGGPTQTQALLPGSPAIDAGNPTGCSDNKGHLLKTDQRGMPRPDKEDTGGCDMGAYECQSD